MDIHKSINTIFVYMFVLKLIKYGIQNSVILQTLLLGTVVFS